MGKLRENCQEVKPMEQKYFARSLVKIHPRKWNQINSRKVNKNEMRARTDRDLPIELHCKTNFKQFPFGSSVVLHGFNSSKTSVPNSVWVRSPWVFSTYLFGCSANLSGFFGMFRTKQELNPNWITFEKLSY